MSLLQKIFNFLSDPNVAVILMFAGLAGLYIETIGRLPAKNETTTIADARLTILAKDENRILRLKLEKIAKGPELER